MFECETKHAHVFVCVVQIIHMCIITQGDSVFFMFRDDVCVFMFVCDE